MVKRRFKKRSLVTSAALATAAAYLQTAGIGQAGAATIPYTGSSAGAWLTPGNWSGGVVPGGGDVAQFLAPNNATSVGINMNGVTNNGTGNQIVGEILLTSGGVNRSVGNSSTTADGTLHLAGVGGVAIQNTTSNSLTIQNTAGGGNKLMNLFLGPTSIDITSSGSVSISSVILGGSGLFKTGTGTGVLSLGAVNRYTGTTQVNGGTLTTTVANAIPLYSPVNLASGTTLNTNSTTQSFGILSGLGTVQLPGSSGLFITGNDNGSGTFAGVFQNQSSTIVKVGTGDLRITINEAASGGPSIGHRWNGGTYTYAGAGKENTGGFQTNYFNTGVVVLDNSSANDNDRIANSLAWNIQGGGVTLIGNAGAATNESTSTGGFLLNSGMFTATVSPNAAQNAKIQIGNQGGGLIRSNQAMMFVRGANLGSTAAGGSIVVNPGTSGNPNGTQLGGGGAPGTTTRSIVPWIIGGTSANDTGTTFVDYVNDAAIGFRPLPFTDFTSSITSGTTTADNVRLTTSQSIAATTTRNSLIIATGGGLTNSATAVMHVESGAVLFSDNGTIGTSTLSLRTFAGRELVISAGTGFTGTIDALIPDNGTTKATFGGNGTIVLTNPSNAWADRTTINSATVSVNALANVDVLSPLGKPSNAATGTIQIAGGTLKYTGSGTGHSTNRTVNLLSHGTIDASGAANQAVTFTGGITATSGNAGNGQRHDLILTGTGVGLQTGVITGTGSNPQDLVTLVKSGTGTWKISGASTYAGGTLVNQGTLRVNNTTGSGTGTGSVRVNSGGTLGGSGVISGAVDLYGTISPGESPGKLTTAAETWAPGGTYKWELNSGTGTKGGTTGWDWISMTGALNLSTLTSSSKFKIDITSQPVGSDTNGSPQAGTVTGNQSWIIATSNTTITAFDPDWFDLQTTNWSPGGSFTITRVNDGGTSNALQLNLGPLVTAGHYTLAVGPTAANVLLNGKLAIPSATINNVGTGTNDGISFTGLTATEASPNATISGSATGGIVNTTPGTPTSLTNSGLTFTGTGYDGGVVVSGTVTTANNVVLGGAATHDAGDVTATYVVGLAKADQTNTRTNFGPAMQGAVALGESYAGLESKTAGVSTAGAGAPILGSIATILMGTNITGGDETVSMAWRTRNTGAQGEVYPDGGTPPFVAQPSGLGADVVRLTGMANGVAVENGRRARTDAFTLQMTYDGAGDNEQDSAIAGQIFMVWLDTDPQLNDAVATAGGTDDRWVNAVNGNFYDLSNPTVANRVGDLAVDNYLNDFDGAGGFAAGSWDNFVAEYGVTPANLHRFVGSWGVNITDTGGHDGVVWAVLNHNSDFSVVPEPSSLGLVGMAGLGLMNWRQRRKKR